MSYKINDTVVIDDSRNVCACCVTSCCVTASDQMVIPSGTTACRPTGTTGSLYYDTDEGALVAYDGTTWAKQGGGGDYTLGTPCSVVNYKPTFGADAIITPPLPYNEAIQDWNVSQCSGVRFFTVTPRSVASVGFTVGMPGYSPESGVGCALPFCCSVGYLSPTKDYISTSFLHPSFGTAFGFARDKWWNARSCILSAYILMACIGDKIVLAGHSTCHLSFHCANTGAFICRSFLNTVNIRGIFETPDQNLGVVDCLFRVHEIDLSTMTHRCSVCPTNSCAVWKGSTLVPVYDQTTWGVVFPHCTNYGTLFNKCTRCFYTHLFPLCCTDGPVPIVGVNVADEMFVRSTSCGTGCVRTLAYKMLPDGSISNGFFLHGCCSSFVPAESMHVIPTLTCSSIEVPFLRLCAHGAGSHMLNSFTPTCPVTRTSLMYSGTCIYAGSLTCSVAPTLNPTVDITGSICMCASTCVYFNTTMCANSYFY